MTLRIHKQRKLNQVFIPTKEGYILIIREISETVNCGKKANRMLTSFKKSNRKQGKAFADVQIHTTPSSARAM